MSPRTALPETFEMLRDQILQRRGTLPKRIAQVAAYALDNPDEIAFGTAASIAGSAGVQPSTLIRFAQHVGFDGFTSLQAVFRERLRERTSTYDERLVALRGAGQGAQNRRILEGFVAASSQSLESLRRNIDDATLDRAVALLSGAGTIFIVARRRSYPIASYLAYAFGRLKIRYQVVDSVAGLDPEMLGFATTTDAAIAVSFSPYAAASLEHARGLVQAGVPLVAITDSSFSPLAEVANEWFEVSEADCAGFRSLSASMALAMTLAVAVAEVRRAPGTKSSDAR